ncbi:MAG: nucleotide exchange factor GrpE [Planctomycetia bacterium]
MTNPDPTPTDPAAPAAEASAGAALPSAAELEALRAEAARAAGLEDRLKRAQAEFVNEGRRIQRQAEQDRRFAIEGLLKELVSVVENLDTALKAVADAGPLKAGGEMVLVELEGLLRRHGAEVLRPAGQPFDPLHHEALSMVEHPSLPAGHVAQVLSPGLALHGRNVRPARVTVVRAPAAAPSAAPADPAPEA